MADALAAAGEEPTIRTVQARLGAGSYTTVKHYLEAWRAQRQDAPPGIVVPEEIAAKGAELARALSGAAAALAEQRTQQARMEVQRATEQAQAALADAEQTIARMEQEHKLVQRQAEQAQATVEALRAELAEVRRSPGRRGARCRE